MKKLSFLIVLLAIIVSGCAHTQIHHKDGRVETRLEILPGSSMTYGVSRGSYYGQPFGYGHTPFYNYNGIGRPGTTIDCSSGVCNPRFTPVY